MVSLADYAPTLLDAAGLPVPAAMTGDSIMPLIEDPGSPWKASAFIQVSEAETGRAIRTQRWKYAVRAENHDIARSRADAYAEAFLYDLDRDPYELDNLAGLASHRAIADELKAELLRWIERIEGEQPRIIDAEERHPGLRQMNVRGTTPGW